LRRWIIGNEELPCGRIGMSWTFFIKGFFSPPGGGSAVNECMLDKADRAA